MFLGYGNKLPVLAVSVAVPYYAFAIEYFGCVAESLEAVVVCSREGVALKAHGEYEVASVAGGVG